MDDISSIFSMTEDHLNPYHDPNRLNREHVKTVYSKKDEYFVVIEYPDDHSTYEVSWSAWVRKVRDEIRNN